MTFFSNKFKFTKKWCFLLTLIIFSLSFHCFGQTSKPSISLDEIVNFLRLPTANLEIRNKRLREQIEERGIDFVFTQDVFDKLVKSGAKSNISISSSLIDIVQQTSLRGAVFYKKTPDSSSIDVELKKARTALKKFWESSYKNETLLKNAITISYGQVITSYKNAVNVRPKSAELYYERIRALELYSPWGYVDIDTLFNDYTKVINLNPQFALAYYDRGLTYLRQPPKNGETMSKYEERFIYSIKDFSEFIRLKPQYAKALDNNYANIFYLNGNRLALECKVFTTGCEEAITNFSKASELCYISESLISGFDCGLIYQRRASVYEKLMKYEQAIADTNTAIQISKGIDNNYREYSYYLLRGRIFYLQDKCDLAIIDFSKGIKNSDLNLGYPVSEIQMRGLCYYKNGEFNKAVSDFLKLIELDPRDKDYLNYNYVDNFYYLGNSYYKKGEFDKAIKNYSKAIDLLHRPYATNSDIFSRFLQQSRENKTKRLYLNARADAYEKIGRKDLAEADRIEAKQ